MTDAASDSGTSLKGVPIRRSLIRNLFLLIVLLTGTILLSTVYTGQRIARSASEALIGSALHSVRGEVHGFTDPVQRSLLLGAQLARTGVVDLDDPAAMNAVFMPLVEEIPQISAVNVGTAEGRGYLLWRFPDRWRNRLVWTDRWGDRIEFSEWSDETTLLRKWTVEEPPEDERYDPRTRDWYRVAVEPDPEVSPSSAVYWTDVYKFFTTGEPGVTAMVRVQDATGHRFVLAYDVALSDLTDFTRRLEVSPNGFAFLLAEDGRVLGLPGLPRFDDPKTREAALLNRPGELGVVVIEDATRRFESLPPDQRGIFSFQSGGGTWWADVRPYPLGTNRELTLAALVPQEDLVGIIGEQRLLLAGISMFGFGIATAMAFWLARRYGSPLATLAENSQRIGTLELTGLKQVESNLREVDQLAAEQDRMRLALDAFSRYVPMEIIRELLTRGEAARIGGANREITSLFTDIAGFTTISEHMSPETLMVHVAEYFEELLGIIQADGYGTVTQLNGDGITAMWGAPKDVQDHARRAIHAVVRCQERLVVLNSDWHARGLAPLPTRFGLASGPALIGNVGAASRLVYTAMGDTVNLASRLEGLGRSYGVSVVAAASTREAAGPGFAWRMLDVVRVKGKERPVEVVELLGSDSDVGEKVRRFAARYEEALAFYRSRSFASAVEILEDLLLDDPGDLSVERLLGLARTHAAHPPPEDWDGVSNFDEK
jgi:adenylate cyclase